MHKKAKDPDLDIALQDLVDCLEDELLVIDSDYRIRLVNSAVCGRFDKRYDSLIGRLCYEVLHDRDKPCSAPLWDCPLRQVLQSSSVNSVVHPNPISGTEGYLKITACPVWDSHGNVKAIVELRRDVSAERELETHILRRHHQLLAMCQISNAVSGMWNLDTILGIALDNMLETMNGVIGGILLLDKETQILSYRVYRGISAQTAEKVRLRLGEGITGTVAQNGQSILFDNISTDPRALSPDLVRREGVKGCICVPLRSKETVMGVIYVASHEAGQFGPDDMALLNSIGDHLGAAIEQARLFQQLTRAGERYKALLQHTLTAQEDVRKRIASELHDETSQSITSLTLSLQAIIGIAEMKGIGDADFVKRLKDTHSYAVHAGNEIVRIMKELRPTLLDELGLPAAIHRHAKDSLQARGINISAEFEGVDERLSPEIEVTLFRIAQSAIGNILEHSEAKNAYIKLECNADECLLHIEDDGKGFDLSKITQVDPRGRGAGLFTIKERANLLGGHFHVDTQPLQGTKLTVKIPRTRDVSYEEDKSANNR